VFHIIVNQRKTELGCSDYMSGGINHLYKIESPLTEKLNPCL